MDKVIRTHYLIIMSSTKADSLKWAIDELSKQRTDLDSQLKVARKRDETNLLIEEVVAQKAALEQRISALEDGHRVSTELVDIPCTELETEMSKIDEKLEIAQERLQTIEQEEYLEELGKKLNGSHKIDSPEVDIPATSGDSIIEDLNMSSSLPSENPPISSEKTEAFTDSPKLSAAPQNATSTLMKATSNRIPETELQSPEDQISEPASKLSEIPETSVHPLEETAAKLGIEPEFLAEKGLQAILRMVARNGGKLSFPLEVDQIG